MPLKCTVQSVLSTLESISPARFAFSFDSVGLLLGDRNAPVTRALVALDHSMAAVDACIAADAQLLVCHHPIFLKPVQRVNTDTYEGRVAWKMAKNGISLITAHTNWDSAMGGVNDALAAKLGLTDVTAFGSGAEVSRYKLVTYIPLADADAVAQALAEAGAGRIGNYEQCSFRSEGEGRFRPLSGANPAIGEVGELTRVPEVRLEVLVPGEVKAKVLRALVAAHPYEEPAYDLIPLEKTVEQPAGRIGLLPAAMPLEQFSTLVSGCLNEAIWTFGDPKRPVRKVAVVGGAADGDWMHAQRAAADVFVTGEVKQHVGLEASECGMPIIAAGHYATEQPGVIALRDHLAHRLTETDFITFEPELGQGGRPFGVKV